MNSTKTELDCNTQSAEDTTSDNVNQSQIMHLSATREQADGLVSSGFSWCRVPTGKAPKVSRWQLACGTKLQLGDNLGFLTGPLSGGVICVDLDMKSDNPETNAKAREVFDRCLPHTDMIDHIPGRDPEHRYYRITDTVWPDELLPGRTSATYKAMMDGYLPRFGAKRHYPCKDGIQVDFLLAGGMCVCPPSLHHSGIGRAWVGGTRGEPAEATYADLRAAVESACVELGYAKIKKTKAGADDVAAYAPRFERLAPEQVVTDADVLDALDLVGDKSRLKKLKSYLGSVPTPAHGRGEDFHGRQLWAACVCAEFGVSENVAVDVFIKWCSQTAGELEDDDYLRGTLSDGYNRATFGAKLVKVDRKPILSATIAEKVYDGVIDEEGERVDVNLSLTSNTWERNCLEPFKDRFVYVRHLDGTTPGFYCLKTSAAWATAAFNPEFSRYIPEGVDEDGEPTKPPPASVFLLYGPSVPVLHDICYTPGGKRMHKEELIDGAMPLLRLNEWRRPFEPKQVKDWTAADRSAVEVIDAHIKNLLTDADGLVLRQHIAFPLINPGKRMCFAYLMLGGFGCGKSLITEVLVAKLYGVSNCIAVDNQMVEDDKGGVWKLRERVVIPELTVGLYDKLKQPIADRRLSIRKMKTDPYDVTNYLSVIAMSNDMHPLDIPEDDRRWYVADCRIVRRDRGHEMPKEESDRLAQAIDNHGPALMQWFMDTPMEGFDERRPPMTDAKMRLTGASKSADLLLFEKLLGERVIQKDVINFNVWVERFARENKRIETTADKEASMALTGLGFESVGRIMMDGERTRWYVRSQAIRGLKVSGVDLVRFLLDGGKLAC